MAQTRHIPRSAALMTALALSGCWGGAPVTQPSTPAAPVEVSGQTPPAAPTNDEFTTLQGQVALRGMPWANAKLQVVDALTGKVAGAAGSALRVEGELKTDAQGNFSVRVAGLGVGKVARLIATLDSGTLSALISSDGPMAAGYHVQASNFSLKVNEITLCLDQVASGVLKMAGGLKSAAAADLIKTVLADLNAMAPKIESAFKQDDMLAITLSLTANPLTGLVTESTDVTKVLAKAGVTGAVDAAVKTATNTVAKLAADKLNVTNADAIQNVSLIGTTLKVSIEGGVFKVTDPATGDTITIDLPAAPAPSTPSTGTPSTSSGSSGSNGNSGPTVAFNPTATFDTAAKEIRLKVTQAPGESDIASIVVRVPVVQAIGAVAVANLSADNPAGSLNQPTGTIRIGSSITLNMTGNAAPNKSLDLTGLPGAPFGTTLNYLAGVEKEGTLNITSMSNGVLGNVRIFTGTEGQRWYAAPHLYVAAKYTNQPQFNNATSLITTHGHQSELSFTLQENVTFLDNKPLDIQVYVTPRSSGAAARLVTATYDASVIP